jgi:hypothetical protein
MAITPWDLVRTITITSWKPVRTIALQLCNGYSSDKRP